MRPVRQLRRAAVRRRGVAGGAGRRAAPSSAAPASRSRRRRCGPPGWRRRRAAVGQDRRRRAGAPGPGRRPAVRPRLGRPAAGAGRRRTRPTARCPTTSRGAVVEVLKAWAHGDDPWPAPAGRGGRRSASRRRPAAGASRWPSGSPTVGRLPLLGTVEPAGVAGAAGAARQQRPAGPRPARRVRGAAGPGRRAGRRWTARCCWSTTWSTPAGRWRSWPGCCAARAHPACCRSRWRWRVDESFDPGEVPHCQLVSIW